MGRSAYALMFSSLFSIPAASAQITGDYGYYGSASILDLISHIIGVRVGNPYELAGLLATIGVLWVATYIVFKVAIQFMDENIGDDYGNYFADAVGIASDEDRNILAVLTLLVVLTMLGTAGFAGIINGWQSLIILAFAFALLAGVFFVFFGGIGVTAAGIGYGAGLGGRATVRGVNQLQQAVDEIDMLEREVDEEEEEEEDDIDEGDDEEADEEAEYTEEEIEQILAALEDAVDDLGDLTASEIEDLAAAMENLEEIVDLLEAD